LQVSATNRAVDLVDDNIDIAIRARVRSADEALMMRMLYKGELIFVASPAFASENRNAIRVDTLPSLPFLSFLENPRRPTWTLNGPNAATTTVSFDPILRSGDFTILLNAAAAGLGIALFSMRATASKEQNRKNQIGKSKTNAGQGHLAPWATSATTSGMLLPQ
jgi:DNA-binding transcriptional LysR family regulator